MICRISLVNDEIPPGKELPFQNCRNKQKIYEVILSWEQNNFIGGAGPGLRPGPETPGPRRPLIRRSRITTHICMSKSFLGQRPPPIVWLKYKKWFLFQNFEEIWRFSRFPHQVPRQQIIAFIHDLILTDKGINRV